MGIKAIHAFKRVENPATEILSDINLEIFDGDFVSLTGKSGSGKSTLLYLLSTLDHPTSGSIEIDGKTVSGAEICDFRNQQAGFIFQHHYLISELSVLENVLLPAARERRKKEKTVFALSLLDRLGLKDKIGRFPRQLSGGEAQRAAIARALIMQPKYLFADEPTGSLDSMNANLVMKMLQQANQELKATIILVTHDSEFASMAKRQIHLSDGKICNQRPAAAASMRT